MFKINTYTFSLLLWKKNNAIKLMSNNILQVYVIYVYAQILLFEEKTLETIIVVNSKGK